MEIIIVRLPEKSINSFNSLNLHKTRDKTFAPWTQPEMIWDEFSCTAAGGEMIWYSQPIVARYHSFTYTHTRILAILQPGSHTSLQKHNIPVESPSSLQKPFSNYRRIII